MTSPNSDTRIKVTSKEELSITSYSLFRRRWMYMRIANCSVWNCVCARNVARVPGRTRFL